MLADDSYENEEDYLESYQKPMKPADRIFAHQRLYLNEVEQLEEDTDDAHQLGYLFEELDGFKFLMVYE